MPLRHQASGTAAVTLPTVVDCHQATWLGLVGSVTFTVVVRELE
jgi:hypothetical protein